MTVSLAQRQRTKKCAVCRSEFVQRSTTARVCGMGCAIKFTAQQHDKKERREHGEAKAKAKTRRDWLREAQAAFNAYIRVRDSAQPCISCGRMHEGQWHAGHYRPTSTAPALRFHEDNVHKQCQPCNTHLHGNLVEYRINLARKIGPERLEWLEGQHEPAKYSIQDLQDIKRKYSVRARERNRKLVKGLER